MLESDEQRSFLHSRLDQACDSRISDLQAAIEQVEDERRKGHEWIDSAPESVLRALTDSGGVPLSDDAQVQRVRKEEFRVPLYEPIKEIVQLIDPQHTITSVIIHDALLQRIPELKKEDQRKLKARISATLGRLAEERLLKITRQGGGSVPHKYRIITGDLKPGTVNFKWGPKDEGQ